MSCVLVYVALFEQTMPDTYYNVKRWARRFSLFFF